MPAIHLLDAKKEGGSPPLLGYPPRILLIEAVLGQIVSID